MTTTRSFINWIQTLSATHNAELKAQARRIIAELRQAHHRIVGEAKLLGRAHMSEMRYKSLLARIDTKLLALTNAMFVAQISANRMMSEKLAVQIAKWNAHKKANEANVNLIRRRINTARHAWAKLDKDAKTVFASLNDMLVGARPVWAENAREIGLRLLQSVTRQRRIVADKMTASALFYDGRDLSPALAQLRRAPLASV